MNGFALQRRLKGTGITVSSVDPGIVGKLVSIEWRILVKLQLLNLIDLL